MNYHHIYHAGNFADIFKHVILALCLEKLHEKPAPFFILDTHAGIGKYDLSDEKSLKTFEADEGIKKLITESNFLDFLPARYLTILAKLNHCEISELPEKMKVYSGSPILIKDYLRARDRAIFSELNYDDFIQLKRHFAGNPKFSIMREDGFHLLQSKLPPLEKRGLTIIDPAFEKDQSKVSADWEKIILGLEDAFKRFAHGVYLIWYPIIKTDEDILRKFRKSMANLKFAKIMHASFDVGSKAEDTRMSACGMYILNAPWQLDEKMQEIMPKILEVIGRGENKEFKIEVIR